ncbi:MAG: FtsX-like permease family protein [Pseudomonadota bacterium]
MRALRFAAARVLRELRSGELVVLLLALIIAVASMTAISFLTDRIGKAVERQAGEVLAADIRLSSGRALDRDPLRVARSIGLAAAEAVSFPSVTFAGESSTLARLQAVSIGYPLRGELRLADALFGDERVASGIPERGTLYAEPALLTRLGVDVGDSVELGKLTLTVAAVLTYRPDQSPGFSGLAPTILVNIDDLPDSGLIVTGSRVRYFQLYAGEAASVDRFAEALRADLDEGVSLQQGAEEGSQLAGAVERAGRFLSLASLVSLVLAAVAIAMSAHRYAERRLDTAALMKTFGASQGFVMLVGVLHILIVGLVACSLGAALGFFAERGLSALLAGWLRGDLPEPGALALVPGVATAFVLLAGFALPSLLRLGRTPPMRVLRDDLAPPPLSLWATYGAALAAIGVIVGAAVRDATLLVVILGGTAATAAVLFAAGRGLVAVLARFRGSVGVSWRYGLANVARRGSTSAVQVVAFGLGLMVLLLLTLVRNDLLGVWRSTVAEDAPNQFLINILPDEREAIDTLLTSRNLESVGFVPLVRGRLAAVNGTQPPAEGQDDRVRIGREINITWSDRLDPSNEITAGEFWTEGDGGVPQVSMDIAVANGMGVTVGDMLTFDFAGIEHTAEVTSLRAIDWDSFRPNFFVMLSPTGMAELPQTYLNALYVPQEERDVLVDLVRAHPSVSVIDIEAAIAQVRGIIDKAALAVQYVFLFTLAAGLVVLFAAIQSTLETRRYESALLRTFGASRRTVLLGILAEFSALGLLAGICAALGATVIGLVAAEQVFKLELSVNPLLWVAGVLAGWLMVGLSGTLAARSAAETPPIRTLRGL